MPESDNTNPPTPDQGFKWTLKKVIIVVALGLVVLVALLDIGLGLANGSGINFEHINGLLDKLISLLQSSGDT